MFFSYFWLFYKVMTQEKDTIATINFRSEEPPNDIVHDIEGAWKRCSMSEDVFNLESIKGS